MVKSKPCRHCGRDFEWRKKWKENWDEVKHCSARCSNQNKSTAAALEECIMSLLKARGHVKSICPSEVLDSNQKENKIEMEQIRSAARRLVHKGLIVITQKNKVVDPSHFKGPIRLKLK